MAQLTHTEFEVDDQGGGSTTRTFNFDTTSQGGNYAVKISFPGSGPIFASLNKENPSAEIKDTDARVKPTGTLTLSWNNDDQTVLVLFSGTLHTMHSVTMENVCVGALD
jgi:hypothetical protein